MKKSKILSCLLATLVVVSMFVGCDATTKATSTSKSTISKAVNLTDKEKNEILSEIKLYTVDTNHSLEDLESLVDKNIASFDEDDKDTIISDYMSQMYVACNDISSKLNLLGYELEDVLKNNSKIDVNNSNTYKLIPDTSATVRGLLQEIQAKGFVLERNTNSNSYQITVDNQKVLDKYKDYMSDSLRSYLEFSAYEDSSAPVGNSSDKTVDIDEVSNRILKIENGLETDKSSGFKHIAEWMSASDYYYSILLGVSHDYFVTSDYLNEDVLQKYQDIANANEGTTLAKVLNDVINIYTESNRHVDNDVQNKVSQTVTDDVYTQDIREALAKRSESNSSGTDVGAITGTEEEEDTTIDDNEQIDLEDNSQDSIEDVN